MTFPGSFEFISVDDGLDGSLKISLRRTIRVPDNDESYSLPPDCGPFPLYSIDHHKEKLPRPMVAAGGVFVPMYRE